VVADFFFPLGLRTAQTVSHVELDLDLSLPVVSTSLGSSSLSSIRLRFLLDTETDASERCLDFNMIYQGGEAHISEQYKWQQILERRRL
jgi:hypothetical protein